MVKRTPTVTWPNPPGSVRPCDPAHTAPGGGDDDPGPPQPARRRSDLPF